MQARRDFIKKMAFTGLSAGLITHPFSSWTPDMIHESTEIKLRIVGLSPHSATFSTLLNDDQKAQDLAGYRIVSLYHPPGNPDVEFKVDLSEFTCQSVKVFDHLIGFQFRYVPAVTNYFGKPLKNLDANDMAPNKFNQRPMAYNQHLFKRSLEWPALTSKTKPNPYSYGSV